MQVSVLKPEGDCAAMDIVPALQFYKRGYRDTLGLRYYYGNPNPKVKKSLCIASGAALQNCRDKGLDDNYMLNSMLEQDGKFSRLDLAVTEYIEKDLVTVEDVEAWFKRGLVESPLCSGGAEKLQSIEPDKEDILETLYIGDLNKRGTRGIFRAYDKGVEFELPEHLITRLELENRGEVAHACAERIARDDNLAGNFRTRFNVKHHDFDRLMDSEIVKPMRGKAKPKPEAEIEMDRRWKWLMDSVAPAMKEAIEFDEKRGFGRSRPFNFAVAAGLKWADKVDLLDTSD